MTESAPIKRLRFCLPFQEYLIFVQIRSKRSSKLRGWGVIVTLPDVSVFHSSLPKVELESLGFYLLDYQTEN